MNAERERKLVRSLMTDNKGERRIELCQGFTQNESGTELEREQWWGKRDISIQWNDQNEGERES